MSAFGGQELYPSAAEKGAALAYSIIRSHPFIDGNKRAALASMATFFDLNRMSFVCDAAEAERIILSVASNTIQRAEFVLWVESCLEA